MAKKAPSRLEIENEELATNIKTIFEESDQTFGVVRIQTVLKRQGKTVNIKRVRRLMRLLGLKSVIRCPRQNYVRTVAEHTAENIIARDFEAEKPNQKWFTDVSYLKYGNGEKAYISAIIDRYDLSIVSWKISKRNDNELVMETIKEAFELNPSATPIIHSDRGYQYTSREYKSLEEKYGFIISMSRVSKCLDNQPIESF